MVTASIRTPTQDATSRAAAIAALSAEPAAQEPNLEAELLGGVPAAAAAPATVTTPPARTSLVPVARGGSVAVSKGSFYEVSDGAVEGEFDSTDTRHPTLKIVQGSGPLTEKFSHGTIILGDEELLPPPPADAAKAAQVPPLIFFPIQIKKQYQEILPDGSFQDGLMPKIVDTIEEVEALGGTIQYIEGATNRWRACGRILMLVERPANCEHPLFAIELDNRVFAPAVYFAAGGGYAATIKSIWGNKTSMFVTEGNTRKIRLWKCAWSFRPTKGKAGELRMLLKDTSGPELHDFARGLISGAPDSAESTE
jgi:hypothetical protein